VVLVWAKVALEIKHTAGQPCLTMLFDYISEQGTAPALWIVEVPSAMCEGDQSTFADDVCWRDWRVESA
jgi:hypothetical protein